MKKILLIILLSFFVSCSNEDDSNNDKCCDTTISEIKESYTRIYNQVQNDPEATEQQKLESKAEYEARMENPCESYKIYTLAPSGAPCANNI